MHVQRIIAFFLFARFLIFFSGVGIIIFLNLEWQDDRKLPVYKPNDINPELVDSSLHGRGREESNSSGFISFG